MAPLKATELERRREELLDRAGLLDYQASAQKVSEWLTDLGIPLKPFEDCDGEFLYDCVYWPLEHAKEELEPKDYGLTEDQGNLLSRALHRGERYAHQRWLDKMRAMDNIDRLRADHLTELHKACLMGDAERVRCLLELNANPYYPVGGIAGASNPISCALRWPTILTLVIEHANRR